MRDLTFNESISAARVMVYDGRSGGLVELDRDQAISLARRSGLDLVVEIPSDDPSDVPVCRMVRLSHPVRWEGADEAPPQGPQLQEELWFVDGRCDERHYLIGNAHTFPGRMEAWCPAKQRAYAVSLREVVECSTEAEYFIRGFLTGQEPPPPLDEEGDRLPASDEDDRAWTRAIRRFHETGVWVDRVRFCERCGARLLPSTVGLVCSSCTSRPG